MALEVRIVSGDGSGDTASVNPDGSLHVGAVKNGTPYTASAVVINTGYNYVTLDGEGIVPKQGKVFKISSILISADRNVGATTGALVNIYEADSPTSITSTKDIVKDFELIKNNFIFMNVDIRVTKGKWVNIKTDDNNIRSTIIGYYADE